MSKKFDLSDNDFSLTKQICSLWTAAGQFLVSSNNVLEISPELWSLVLRTMHTILAHPNQMFSHIALQFWREFLRHSELHRLLNNEFVELLLLTCPPKLVKQEMSTLSTAFEFDGKEEYDAFYFKYRAEMLDLLRNLTLADEKTSFKCVQNIFRSALSNTASTSEWEVVANLLDAVCNKIKDISSVSRISKHSFDVLVKPDYSGIFFHFSI